MGSKKQREEYAENDKTFLATHCRYKLACRNVRPGIVKDNNFAIFAKYGRERC